MMKKRHILHWAMGVIMTPLLGSCTTDDAIGGAGREECDIFSGQPMTVTSETKATDGRTSSTQFDSGETVWLWANKTDGTEYIKAWQLTAQSEGSFTGTYTNKYWPSDGSKLNFHALHGNFTESDLNNNWSDLTSLKHTVLDDQSSDEYRRQSDLLFAEKAEATHGNNVELSFSHLLAKITVKLDLKNSTGITTDDFENATVSIMGIKPEATFDSSAKTASTSGGTAKVIQAGTISKPTELMSEAYDAGCAIVPLQTIPAEQQLIKITLNDRNFIYKASEETTFQKGMEYTYTLTILGEKISGSLSVSEFSSENKPISFKDYFPYLADLKNRNVLGSEADPHDLSYDYNGLMNTANCYVVTHPGYYKFPLVYGNAIKNGATNAIAYGVKDGTRISSTFVNHLGKQITNPYIYNNKDDNDNNLVAKSVELLWQDAKNLISNISLCDNDKYIKFEITKDNIEQGNAVIAVKHTDGTIMWSWHIWVTNKNVYETVPIKNKALSGITTQHTYNFMPVPLGWDDDIPEQPNCPYYQYGRKDPFCPSDGKGNNNKTLYDSQISFTEFKSQSGAVTTDKAIQNPHIFYYVQDSHWNTVDSKDFWDVGNSDNGLYDAVTHKSVKSVYDPSPVGYKTPEPAAWTKFTTYNNGDNTNDSRYFNVANNSSTFLDDGGWKFYTQAEGQGDWNLWHALGFRDVYSKRTPTPGTGGLLNVGSGGHYWSCGPSTTATNGRGLTFTSGYVNPQSQHYRAYGLPVRPVSE